MKRTLALLAFLLAATPAFAAGFDDAQAAFVKQDYDTAKKLAEPLAKAGDGRAMTLLGTIYRKGLGQLPDFDIAMDWFTKGAAAGDTGSILQLGVAQLDVREAAEKGDAAAQFNLGVLNSGAYNNPPDWPEALKWFTASANQGNRDGQYYLGLMYLQGNGVDRNEVTAASWIGKAASQGNSDAALDYGVLVFQGVGVKKDEKIGTQWLMIAAQKGNPIAQNRIARLYTFGGGGISPDPVSAMMWNVLAKHAGRGDAELDGLLGKLTPAQLAEVKLRLDAFRPQ